MCHVQFAGVLAALVALPVWLGGQSLDSLRERLLSVSPDLRARRLLVEAEGARARGAGAFPELELSGGLFALPVETRVGPQLFRLGATQMLPWPGKLAAERELAAASALPVAEEVAVAEQGLIYRLETAYFDLLCTRARAQTLARRLPLYESLYELALARVESGGSAVDVYQLQLEREALQQRIAELDYATRRKNVALNALLELPLGNEIAPPSTAEDWTERALAAIQELAGGLPVADHPQIKLLRLQSDVSQKALVLNDLDARPDFGVGIDYIATGRRDDVMLENNGRDVIVVRAAVRIPLDTRRYRARGEEEALRIRSLEVRREAVDLDLRADLARAVLTAAEQNDRLAYLDAQLELLDAALTAARTEYAQNRRPLEELLRLSERQIEYETERVDARQNLLNAYATVRSVTLNY